MPPKKEKNKSSDQPPTVNEVILKKFIQFYDAYCKETNSFTCPDIITSAKKCLEDNKTLTKLVLIPIDKDPKLEEKYKKALKKAEEANDLQAINDLKANFSVSSVPPLVLVEPMLRALNDVQYSACRDLYIADLPIFYSEFVELTNFINIRANLIRKIQLLDCVVGVESVRRFSTVFNNKPFLNSVCLDYNEFGDEGCRELYKGLIENKSLVSLSLNYCNLGPDSGRMLGELLATTALRELFLDGNELKCHGAFELVKTIAEEAEKADLKRELEEKLRKEEEEARRLLEENNPSLKAEETKPAEEDKKDEESGKKKKKGKKKDDSDDEGEGKKKKSEEPPLVGPFAQKLHLADNSIDFFEDGASRTNSLNLIQQTINMFAKLIKYSPEIEEIDLHNNSIGNMSAKIILDALEARQKKSLGVVAVRVSERIEKDMFDQILKMSKNVKKKKGKKKKKK